MSHRWNIASLVCVASLVMQGCVAGGFDDRDAFRTKKDLTDAIPRSASTEDVTRILIDSFKVAPHQIHRRSLTEVDRWVRDGQYVYVGHFLDIPDFRTHSFLISPGLVDYLSVKIYFDTQDRFVEVRTEVQHCK